MILGTRAGWGKRRKQTNRWSLLSKQVIIIIKTGDQDNQNSWSGSLKQATIIIKTDYNRWSLSSKQAIRIIVPQLNLGLTRLWLNFTLGRNLFLAVSLIRETCPTTIQAGIKCTSYKYQTNSLDKYQTNSLTNIKDIVKTNIKQMLLANIKQMLYKTQPNQGNMCHHNLGWHKVSMTGVVGWISRLFVQKTALHSAIEPFDVN